MLGDQGYYAGGISLKAFNSLKLSKDELMNERPLILTPTLTSGLISIAGIKDFNWSYEVYSVLGIKVKGEQLGDKQEIDITNLTTGAYFIRLTNAETGQQQIEKIVKQ